LDPLDEDSISKERLIMGLRLEEGVDLLWVNPEKAKVLYENGLAVNSGGRFILTKSGMLVLNSVLEYLQD